MRLRFVTMGCTYVPSQYCPNDNLTRGQAAVMIIRSIYSAKTGNPEGFSYDPNLPQYFSDVPKSYPQQHPQYVYIQKMAELGITSGCQSGMFCPDDPINYAQLAIFAIRARMIRDTGSIFALDCNAEPGTFANYPCSPSFGDVPSTEFFFPYVQKVNQLIGWQQSMAHDCWPGGFCPYSNAVRGRFAYYAVSVIMNATSPSLQPNGGNLPGVEAPYNYPAGITMSCEAAQNNLYSVNRFVAVDANNVYAEAGTNFGTPPQWPSLWITYGWRQILGTTPPQPPTVDSRLGNAASVTLRSANFGVPAGQTYTQSTKHGVFSGCVAPPPAGYPYIASTRTETVAQTTQTITSSPVGADMIVDTVTCAAPCSRTWFSGSQHDITAPSQLVVGGGLSQFTGWSNGVGSAFQKYTVPATNSTLTANYSTPTVTMIITAAPAGLAVIVDGQSCATPCAKQWTAGSSHTVGVISPQTLAGSSYSFVSWSDGGATSHSITAAATTLTAAFTAQTLYSLTASVNPPGAGAVTPSSGQYAPGTVVQLVAADAFGFTFQSWSGVDSSNGKTATVTMNGTRNVVANFTAPTRTQTINTAPPGLSIIVDGQPCITPCVFQWGAGSAHTLFAQSPQPGSAGVRYQFSGWSDGQAAEHIIAVPATSVTYLATFGTEYYLTTSTSDSSAGSISPASGWFSGMVSINALENPGHTFWGFGGALSGSARPQNLLVDRPLVVIANFAPPQEKTDGSMAAQSVCDPQLHAYCFYEDVVLTRADPNGTTVRAEVKPYLIYNLASCPITLYYKAFLRVGGSGAYGSGTLVADSGSTYRQISGKLHAQASETIYLPGPGQTDSVDAGLGTYSIDIQAYGTCGGASTSVYTARRSRIQVLPRVRLFRGGEEVTNTTVPIFVGQKVNLTAVEEGAGSSTASSRTWAVPFGDQPVGGYTWAVDPQDEKLKGKVTAFTSSGTTEQSLYFIRQNTSSWVDYTVRYGTGLLAQTATARVRFNVARPTIAEGQISAQFAPDPVQFKKELGGDWVLSLGTAIGTPIPGINFLASVSVSDGGDGQLAYVQLVRTKRSYTIDLQNYLNIRDSGGAWFLDGSAPYNDNEPPVSVSPGNFGDVATGDSPLNGAITDDILRLSIDEDFRMFLMYKPNGDGSIWVTLREIDWGWTAIIAHPPGTQWTEHSFESPPNTRGKCNPIPGTCDSIPTISDVWELPEWNDWFPNPVQQ